jgi:hypothetical protein
MAPGWPLTDAHANPIEPSVAGGARIATAIAALLREHDVSSGRTRIFF